MCRHLAVSLIRHRPRRVRAAYRSLRAAHPVGPAGPTL
jgi:hypothetical protein